MGVSEGDPTLEHHNSVIFSLILKKQVRFKQLFELSIRICNRNFAILSRLGVTLISVEDVIFDEKIVIFFINTPPCVRNRVCIKNSKFKKLKTYDSHKIEYGQTYVFKNAKFLKFLLARFFTHRKSFFSKACESLLFNKLF